MQWFVATWALSKLCFQSWLTLIFLKCCSPSVQQRCSVSRHSLLITASPVAHLPQNEPPHATHCGYSLLSNVLIKCKRNMWFSQNAPSHTHTHTSAHRLESLKGRRALNCSPSLAVTRVTLRITQQPREAWGHCYRTFLFASIPPWFHVKLGSTRCT